MTDEIENIQAEFPEQLSPEEIYASKSQAEKDYFDANGEYPLTNEGQTSEIILTPEQVAESEIMAARFNAKEYLKKTDWYVTRQAETGTPIPDDISQKRTEARQTAST